MPVVLAAGDGVLTSRVEAVGSEVAPPVDRPAGVATYRAHLDGLRAVAVYLVVLFHAGVDRFSGGFIGVDVFFVLSGYLVTEVLMRDVMNDGRIDFGRFYARRFRRLLPAAFVTLVVTGAVFTALSTPAEVTQAVSAFKASFLYVANWFFIDQSTDYFADEITRSPVLHFWSLAVEEQFYLLWPLALAALVWSTRTLARSRWMTVRVVVAAGMLASVVWALVLRSGQPNRAYFGTDARAYQLLAGALIALTPAAVSTLRRWPWLPRLAQVGGLLGLVVLATSLLDVGPVVRGVAVTVATVAVILGLEAAERGIGARALSTRAMVYLGRISYGTYLWHWLVIIVATELIDLSTVTLAAITAALATALASLSYQLVEQPIRRSPVLDDHRRLVVVGGLTVSVISALLIIPSIVDPDTGSTATSNAAQPTSAREGFTPVPASFDHAKIYFEKFGQTVDCVGKPADACTVVRGPGTHVLLMGDSNAQMMIPAFTEMARQEGLRLSLVVTAGCPWQQDVYKLTAEIIAACRRTKTDAYRRVIPELRPDVIVLLNAREVREDGATDYVDTEFNRNLRRSTEASLEELSAEGRRLVIIEPMPAAPNRANPLECLAEATYVEECRFVAEAGPTWMERFERDLGGSYPDLTVIDLDRLACPFLPICDPMIGETVVYWNDGHLTERYSRSLATDLTIQLTAKGVLES